MTHPVKPYTATSMATRTAVILFLFTIVFTAALAGVYLLTKPSIDASAEIKKMRTIGEVLPVGSYDNELLKDTLVLPPTTYRPSIADAKRANRPLWSSKAWLATATAARSVCSSAFAPMAR